jgi:hypothetical protein
MFHDKMKAEAMRTGERSRVGLVTAQVLRQWSKQ